MDAIELAVRKEAAVKNGTQLSGKTPFLREETGAGAWVAE
jgi:hypothetical protein